MARFFGPAALVALAVVAACGQPAGPLSLSLTPSSATTPATVRVSGLSSRELSALAGAQLDDAGWQAILRVTVDGSAPDAPAVSGRVAVTSDAVEFTPRFPLDPGRGYRVVFDAARLPTPRSGAATRIGNRSALRIESVLRLPAPDRTPRTTVVRVLPTANTLPENLLRVYLEFSAPMSREHGRDFLTLLDEQGHEVSDAFLALDVDFWSPDGRRYTVFFDPGRVKRGILPNDLFGRALVPGHRFTIAVNPRWRDADGLPMAAAYRHTFAVGPADLAPLRLEDWRIQPPAARTRDPLVVSFPKPLDHGLLQRALGVARGEAMVPGEITIGESETTWRFTPRDAWPAGGFDLVVLSILEDPAGNRIGRSFDIDAFKEIDRTPAPERMTVPFVIRP